MICIEAVVNFRLLLVGQRDRLRHFSHRVPDILDQLDAVVQRPLVDIVPVRPAPAPILDAEGAIVDPNQDGYYPATAQRSRPVGLRIVQTLKNGTTPSNTTFGLRRAYNCFWITL